MDSSGFIIRSPSGDPATNLVAEELLLESDAAGEGVVLYLYTNDSCIVVGKNQNPWLECNLETMARDGIPLHRRISGGGAVYHDQGNLNFSFMMPRSLYSECWPYEMISRVLAGFGIEATRSGKSGMEAGGLKFSGQAYCYRRDRVLHHGTLLVDSNLDRLREYLIPKELDIKTHTIRSTRAHVVNLSALSEELTVTSLDASLESMFSAELSEVSEIEFPLVDPKQIEIYNSWVWQYGRTPRFFYKGKEVVKGRLAGNKFTL